MGYRSTRDLLLANYGSALETRIQESDVSIGTSAAQLVAGNGARNWVSFQNAGAATIYISTLQSLAVGQGFIIAAGGFITLTWRDDGDLPTLAFYAISSGAGNNVHVIETILTGAGD